jgi:alpha-tubulin suppressor-like RCC1 family protein
MLSAGGYHSLAIAGGTVWSWGNGRDGQLGDGTTADVNPDPRPVPGIVNPRWVSAGHAYSLAVDGNGLVWAWGDNGLGQLGDGTRTSAVVPVAVSGLTGVTSVAAAWNSSMALHADSTLWAWGANIGQFGDGRETGSLVPVPAGSGLTGIVSFDLGWDHAIALRADGTVWAWGRNDYGQLGIGSYGAGSLVPVRVRDLTGAIAVAAGGLHSMALRDDGTVWTWGSNLYGALGDGTEQDAALPVQVLGLSGAVAIAGGAYYSFAVRDDGTLWAWGHNNVGQLGNHESSRVPMPVRVELDTPLVTGNVLLATRQGDDVLLEFPSSPGAVGWRVHADPDKQRIGQTPLSPDTNDRSFLDFGAITRPGDDYYLLRGLSMCSQTPEP